MLQGRFNADFDTEIENQFLGVQVPHVHVCIVQVYVAVSILKF